MLRLHGVRNFRGYRYVVHMREEEILCDVKLLCLTQGIPKIYLYISWPWHPDVSVCFVTTRLKLVSEENVKVGHKTLLEVYTPIRVSIGLNFTRRGC